MKKPSPEQLREMSNLCKSKAIDAFRNIMNLPAGYDSDAIMTVFEGTIRAAVLEVCALLEESTQLELKKNKAN